jgi:hypothetical protein
MVLMFSYNSYHIRFWLPSLGLLFYRFLVGFVLIGRKLNKSLSLFQDDIFVNFWFRKDHLLPFDSKNIFESPCVCDVRQFL